VSGPPGNANARQATGRREELTNKEKYRLFCPWQGASALQRKLAILRIIQRPFGAAFWFLEQKITRISDELERRTA
jgi:hypothetical protein